MHCPTCGAANEPNAPFCSECGTPLETTTDTAATIAGQIIDLPADDAHPINDDPQPFEPPPPASSESAHALSTMPMPVPEPAQPPAPPAPAPPALPPANLAQPPGPPQESKRLLVVIAVAALVVSLLCCCLSLAIGAVLGANPNLMWDIWFQLSLAAWFVL